MNSHAFDFDAEAVKCSSDLRQRFVVEGEAWAVERGDVLDEDFMTRLGKFHLVYAWGSLHHTGNMWRAIENAAAAVAPGGLLFLAIYNDQGGTSRRWRSIKRFYHKLPHALRPLLVASCVPVLWWKDFLKGALRGRPFAAWHNYASERGMSPWYDMVDWVGGYPFEVAKPEQVFGFVHARGFSLENIKTVGGGLGCNEFVFRKP
jgi:2-polyprenyl-6-hydroxyphenyl methylase/3-demethylubiquinone-9 3-methyltransferase